MPRVEKLNPRYREEFRAVGYEFGQSVINVIRCPACPKDAKPNTERLQPKRLWSSCLATTRTDSRRRSRITASDMKTKSSPGDFRKILQRLSHCHGARRVFDGFTQLVGCAVAAQNHVILLRLINPSQQP